ncbi:hypothetical protein NS381_20675, partial [Pantoea stewartii]
MALAGQPVKLMVKRVAEAVAPTDPNDDAETSPMLTVWFAAAVSTLQAVSVIDPVKLIVPSAAEALPQIAAARSALVI